METQNNKPPINWEANHPEGKIQLLDGSIIEGHPKKEEPTPKAPEPQQNESNKKEPQVVVTWKRKTRKERKREMIEYKEAYRIRTKPFYDHAFIFMENSERILSDSRIFLAPVPMRSNMAYIGHTPFASPTLGIYIEFWKNYKYAIINDKENNPNLLCEMAGSSLSGRNACTCVDKFGIFKEMPITEFSYATGTFININKRYKEIKEKYDAYTLTEVIEIFSKENRIPEILPTPPIAPKITLAQKIKKILRLKF